MKLIIDWNGIFTTQRAVNNEWFVLFYKLKQLYGWINIDQLNYIKIMFSVCAWVAKIVLQDSNQIKFRKIQKIPITQFIIPFMTDFRSKNEKTKTKNRHPYSHTYLIYKWNYKKKHNCSRTSLREKLRIDKFECVFSYNASGTFSLETAINSFYFSFGETCCSA